MRAFVKIILLLFIFVANGSALAHEVQDVTVIHIYDDRFEPKQIEIQKGENVIFENSGEEVHWPAGDDHPSHILYDGTNVDEHCTEDSQQSFDSCEPLNPGESWEFVFEKTGTFGFHDHYWPQLNGVVTVTDQVESQKHKWGLLGQFIDFLKYIISSIREFFFGLNDNGALNMTEDQSFYELLRGKYIDLVREENPKTAISALREESSTDPKVLSLCHDVLHEIGHEGYEKYGNFANAMEYHEDFCNSGYIHGLFESFFENDSDPLNNLGDQCKNFAEGKREFDLWQCHHGLGHGFMYFTGGHLDDSLSLCESNLESQKDIKSCQNGVYMEVFNEETLPKEKDFVKSDNVFEICREREVEKNSCYLYIPTFLSLVQGMEYIDIFGECQKAEGDYELSCIAGIGSEALKRNMHDIGSVYDLCDAASSGQKRRACVLGLVGMVINQTGSLDEGYQLCENETPVKYRQLCHAVVDLRIVDF